MSAEEMENYQRWRQQQSAGGQQEGGGNAAMGWIIFILIFGVGNLILYATTGIFFFPIPRR